MNGLARRSQTRREAAHTDTGAYKMRDEYKTKWLCGTRAENWGWGNQISRQRLPLVFKISRGTGFGDITHNVNGVEVALKALAQLKAVCPHWESLCNRV